MTSHGEPESLQEALKGDEAREWKQAVGDELDEVEALGTYEIIPRPHSVNAAKCQYTFWAKKDEMNRIICYKAHLILKSFSQIYGIDFHKTFAPTVQLMTLCILLSVAASKGSAIQQADIKNTYLQAELKETIYMELPPMYDMFWAVPKHLKDKQLVCKLLKPLYGSCQGANEWYNKLRGVFMQLGYQVCQLDKAMFYRLKIFTIAGYLTSTHGLTGICIQQVSIHGCHSICDTQVLHRWQVWLWMWQVPSQVPVQLEYSLIPPPCPLVDSPSVQ